MVIKRSDLDAEDFIWGIITTAEMNLRFNNEKAIIAHHEMQFRMIAKMAYDLLDMHEMAVAPDAAKRRGSDIDAICARLNI